SRNGQVKPASLARSTNRRTVIRGTPGDADTWRGLSPSARLRRRTSLILRMADQGRGIGVSSNVCCDCSREGAAPSSPHAAARSASITGVGHYRRNRWAISIGMSGPLPSESAGWLGSRVGRALLSLCFDTYAAVDKSGYV